ncbi:zinc finger CCCH domain-containing protein 7B-like isoform X3 [Syngnathoides biaculeatus]|uniref:zinc finger CCCH domain-containing protein 7B-like isoform X3 n=1 Tax=Syngnathoides biaculeatus TaxID=300417 RepID=UPI002ADE81A7|nr:zinc finger CCCH domain-containing protein 7B-like isoform X3 [Syngnathoides biaculeatus]
MDPQREKRRKEIKEALSFIQSSLPYPDSENYKDFLVTLVCNLLDEGISCFKDGHWSQAVKELSEGLNVSQYVSVEGFQIPQVLLESLYVNRAAAHHRMEEYENGVKDCDKALEVCTKSLKALYLKALCLKQLGQYTAAYDSTSKCLLITHQDKQVNDLAEELANHLGLKKRKPYVSTTVSCLGNVTNPLNQIPPEQCATSDLDRLDPLEDSELIGDDLDDLLDRLPNEHALPESHIQEVASLSIRESTLMPPVQMRPLPPGFFISSIPQFNSMNSLSLGGHKSLDTLDDLSSPLELYSLDNHPGGADGPRLKSTSLDSLDDLLLAAPHAVAVEANQSAKEPKDREKSLDDLLDECAPVGPTCDPSVPLGSVSGVNQLDSLDSLDSSPIMQAPGPPLPAPPQKGTSLDSLCYFSSSAVTTSHSAATLKKEFPKCNNKERCTPIPFANSLSATHDFMQACTSCFPRQGQGINTFVHKPELAHNCTRDILLCRRKAAVPLEWTRVREPPTWTSFTGPFVLCRDLLKSGDLNRCTFGEKCTFAFNQLEIDVWMEERKGTLDRNLLFGLPGVINGDPANRIRCLLQAHKGMFIFLCQECYDRKPRFISKRCREDPAVCSNEKTPHPFDANKCLAFVMMTTNINYRKVRPLSVLAHFELCSQAIRDGCRGERSCQNAHSVIELQTWSLQSDTGISAEEIVKVSTNYHEEEEQKTGNGRSSKAAANGEGTPKGKSLNMKMKFVCAECLRGGVITMPDKALKFCATRAKHPWRKEENTLLVKSLEKSNWVPVRPLPHKKNFPKQYELCTRMLEKKKCDYSESCPFAHSKEEKEMWMYMKNQGVYEMQQMYDMWLTLSANSRQANQAVLRQSTPGENEIVMPADNAEPMCGVYCYLCGKYSNGERQWQQHISTNKHKERLFTYEGEYEALSWNYRFPGASFELCTKLESGCPDGVSCDFAHSSEELEEWLERRDFLRFKLAKAREDKLILPDEVDFGKYNFILHD